MKFSYKTRQVIKDISLNFEKGHLYGIIGPNGCGKTTLLKLISGILKQKFGKVYLDNKNIEDLSIREIAKYLALVSQKNYIEFDYKVREIIKMGRYAHISRFSTENENDKKVVDNVIEQLQLKNLENRIFNALSGGEQQKVIIARAIVQQTKILLLDEPTSHLDINFQLEFMNLFKNYVNDGLIVIIVIHDLNLAAQYCDKMILMEDGKIVDFGEVKSVLTKENIKKVYNIDVVIRENLSSNSIYITPIKKTNQDSIELYNSNNNGEYKIHVICGGGSTKELLPKLKDFYVSVGVVNVLDDDYKLAEKLGYEIIEEAPFSPISNESYEKLLNKLKEVDLIILPNIPFGRGNIRNIKALKNLNKRLSIIEKTPIEERDFTDGIATSIYRQLIHEKKNKTFHNIDDLLQEIQKNVGDKIRS